MNTLSSESSISAPAVSNPVRMGSHLIGDGVDFCVFAGHATEVEVCLFEREADGTLRERRFQLHRAQFGVWSGHVAGVGAGQLYGYRVCGPWNPPLGMLHNPAKVLLDPYARVIGQAPTHDARLYGYTFPEAEVSPSEQSPQAATEHLTTPGVATPISNPMSALPSAATNHDAFVHAVTRSSLDSAPVAALSMVCEPDFAITCPLRTPWEDTVIYETHVVGQTKLLDAVPEELRGTYAGLAHPASIKHLQELGVTAVELLPIHAKLAEPFLTDKGLDNYWGYNTLSFFAPEPSYATKAAQAAGPQAVLDEVKGMVKLLHDAGIEVILDVVYNHSCEGGVDGPTLSWRGLDNTSYYRHDSHHLGRLKDTTGCGNSFDFRRHRVLAMTLDSLRYWVETVGVDGFRFDLAVTLGREGDSFNHNHGLYVAMSTDPTLSTVKLVNEPWDVGPNGWQTGGFPAPTADWNDRYRDCMRSYWLTEPATIAAGGSGNDMREFATRLSGSADLFSHGRIPGGRGIHASVNFITVHDGFSLRDLVSYNEKHNEANLEGNRDGSTFNRSWNHGVEGDAGLTPNSAVSRERRKSIRNLLATLLVSAGTPLLRAGDEFLQTQNGNNNAYCQNSPISWLNWPTNEAAQDEAEVAHSAVHAHNLFETTSALVKLRKKYHSLHPAQFYTGEQVDAKLSDLEWYGATGEPMADYHWFDGSVRTLQMLRSHSDDTEDLLIVFNGANSDVPLHLPHGRELPFTLVWSSEWETPKQAPDVSYAPGARTTISARSVQIYIGAKADTSGAELEQSALNY